MRVPVSSIGLLFALATTGSMAQTVSGSGNANTVPAFTSSPSTGNSTITNSPIAISGNSVGIGTTNPSQTLEIDGNEQIDARSSASSYKVASSFTDLVNNSPWYGIGESSLTLPGSNYNAVQLAGYYGLNFLTCCTQMVINTQGNIGMGIKNPPAALTVQSSGTWSYNEGQENGFQVLSGTNPGSDYTLYMGVDKTNHLSYIQSVQWGIATANLALNARGGNVGIGTTSPAQKLEVAGYIQADSGIYFPGSSTPQTTPWTGVLCGGDYAESVDVTGDRTKYGPGDVMVIDPEHDGKFLKSAEPYSTAVLGIYSTRPGALGRRQISAKNADEVPMAMIGIVPTKVSAENGAIKRGDLLVTSSTPGYAMKGTDRNRLVGAVIGKAMGNLDSGIGVIEVGVTLQ